MSDDQSHKSELSRDSKGNSSSDRQEDTPDSGSDTDTDIMEMCRSYAREFGRRRGQIMVLHSKLHKIPPELNILKDRSISEDEFFTTVTKYHNNLKADIIEINNHGTELLSCVRRWKDLLKEIKRDSDDADAEQAKQMFEKQMFAHKTRTGSMKVSYESLREKLKILLEQRRVRIVEYEICCPHLAENNARLTSPVRNVAIVANSPPQEQDADIDPIWNQVKHQLLDTTAVKLPFTDQNFTVPFTSSMGNVAAGSTATNTGPSFVRTPVTRFTYPTVQDVNNVSTATNFGPTLSRTPATRFTYPIIQEPDSQFHYPDIQPYAITHVPEEIRVTSAQSWPVAMPISCTHQCHASVLSNHPQITYSNPPPPPAQTRVATAYDSGYYRNKLDEEMPTHMRSYRTNQGSDRYYNRIDRPYPTQPYTGNNFPTNNLPHYAQATVLTHPGNPIVTNENAAVPPSFTRPSSYPSQPPSNTRTGCTCNKDQYSLQFNAPKIEIPVFDGENEMEFPMFYDIFMATIDANPAMRPIIKLATMYNHLQGDPKQLIAGVPMTDEYYPMALTILKERYGNPLRIRYKIQHELSQIAPAHSNLDSLNHTLTLIQATVLKLRSNGLDADHFSIVQSILTKFPDVILDQVSLFKPFSEEWSTPILLRVLKDVIRRREEIEELSAEANTHKRFWNVSENQSPLVDYSQTDQPSPGEIQPPNNFRKPKGVSRWYTSEEGRDESSLPMQPVAPIEFAFPINSESNLNEVSISNTISPPSFLSYEYLKPTTKSNISPVNANLLCDRKMRRADSFPKISSRSNNKITRANHPSSHNHTLTGHESVPDNISRRSQRNSTGNGFDKQHRKHAFDSNTSL